MLVQIISMTYMINKLKDKRLLPIYFIRDITYEYQNYLFKWSQRKELSKTRFWKVLLEEGFLIFRQVAFKGNKKATSVKLLKFLFIKLM